MADKKLNIGIAFGGVAPEHEVSVISSLQAIAALDRERYHPVPIYVAKDGTWYTGEVLFDIDRYKDLDRLRDEAVQVNIATGAHGALELVEVQESRWLRRPPRRYEVDVMLPGFHGGSGEDGGLQGLCEVFNVPYTGSGVMGSAIGMDKVHSKMLCRDQGIPVVDFQWFREMDWAHSEEAWLDRLEAALGYPAVVKPARLGSSIGITIADDRAELDAAIEEAFRYDEKVVVEHAVQELREINCSVLGDTREAEPSVLEEPVAAQEDDILSFQDKYMRDEGGGGNGAKGGSGAGGAKTGDRAGGMASLDRIIPAELPEERAREIQQLAVRIFQLFECAGVARIDFMIDEATGEVFFNEINTIPGSFSFYLWEPSGVPFDVLLHRMIEGARRRHRERNGRVRSYNVNLLAAGSLEGIKGAKEGRG